MSNINALSLAKSRPRGLKSTRDVNEYFTILERIMYQIQEAQGGTTGNIVESAYEHTDVAMSPLRASLNALVNSINDARRVFVSASVNYTTDGPTTVSATSTLTVTLNASPEDLEPVTVRHSAQIGDTVTVGAYNITNPGDSITLVYYEDFSGWIIE